MPSRHKRKSNSSKGVTGVRSFIKKISRFSINRIKPAIERHRKIAADIKPETTIEKMIFVRGGI
jgi:hypothetical protein